MNGINNSNAPSFQAKLSVTDLKLNPKKLNAVKNLFEEKTKNYPDDVLLIKDSRVQRDDGTFFHATDFALKNHPFDIDIAFFSETNKFKELFNNNEPDIIAKALAKILKVGELKQDFKSVIASINNNISSAAKAEHDHEVARIEAIKLKNIARVRQHETLLSNFKRLKQNLDADKKAVEKNFNEIVQKITNGEKLLDGIYWD